MSKKRKTSSGRKRSKSKMDAEVYPSLEAIGSAFDIKDDHTRMSIMESSTKTILELIKVKSMERRCLVRRSSHGVETLLICLKRHCNQKTAINILATFTCLCEHKYHTKLLHQGVLDTLLQTIPYCKDDLLLIPYHSLFLKISSGDKKFPIKARLNGLLPITAGVLKRSINDTNSLSIILSVIRILASNATNSMSLGRHGCIGLFPKLLTAYGTYDNKMLQIILKAYSPLLSKKSNSSKKAVANSVPHLLAFFERLHHNDSGGRHVALRKSIINVLSRIIIADICYQSFQKANGLNILFVIAKELNEDSRSSFRILSSATCSLLKKALPQIPLPINAPHNAIPFILDNFHAPLVSPVVITNNDIGLTMMSPNHIDIAVPTVSLATNENCMVKRTRNKSEPTLNELAINLHTLSITCCTEPVTSHPLSPVTSHPLLLVHPLSPTSIPISPRPRSISPLYRRQRPMTPRPRPLSSPSSWFIGIEEQGTNRDGGSNISINGLFIFDKFFPELLGSPSKSSPISKRNLISVCPHSKSSPEILSSPRHCSIDKVSKCSSDVKLSSNQATTITTGHIYTTPGLEESTRVIMNDYLRTIPLGKENLFHCSTHTVATINPLYKRPSKVDRELIFQDVSRFTEQSDIINKVVYDIDDHLVFSTSSSSFSFEVTISSDNQIPTTGSDDEIISRSCIEIPMPSDPLVQSVPPGSLVFSSLSESCNLRKAIQVRNFEYDLLLNSDINTDHHHQWFLFEVKNMSVDCSYRFNIINCEKPDSQFNYGMQPVLYSSLTHTWSRVGTDIMYYKNNLIYKQQCTTNDSGTSEGNSSTGRMGGHKTKTKNLIKRFYTLTFNVTFPHKNDTCYIAYHYPYTYSMLKHDLLIMERQLPLTMSNHFYYNRQELCHTISGNVCPLLTITNLLSDNERINKEYIVLSSRVHPGETNSSWIMKGVLEFLSSADPVADQLRERFVFKIVPMLNPDGVANGSHRCSLSGQDLNRQWISPDPVLHPTIFNTKGLIQWLIEHDKKPFLYCDFHGHSRKKNVFLFGCKNSPIIKELPNILSKMTPLFSLQNCTFNVEKSKESTGRVVVWRLGVDRSYTMESTYCGFDTSTTEGIQVQIEDLVDMGKTFCEGLLRISQKSTDDSILQKEQDEPIAIIKRAPVMEDSSQDDYDSNDEDRSESNTSKSSEDSELTEG